MNITVENLAPCKKLVRFEVDAPAVKEGYEAVLKDFVRQARLPGFRPGKAPRDMVVKQYEKDIADEVKRKLVGDAYRQGIKDHQLQVIGYPDIEEIQFDPGQALQFAATIETEPEFQLPEYRGVPAKREPNTVTEADMEHAFEMLRGRQAKFEKVERAVQQGDIVVVNYTGTCEGKPITEVAPAARGLTEAKNFWVEVKPDSFIPGFAEKLIGASAGDKRTVTVDFAADFVTPQLAGKPAVYEVEVVEVKIRLLPPVDEAFAKSYGAENLERLREGVRADLQNERNLTIKRNIRSQIVRALVEGVTFDLPESTLQQETRNVVYDIVAEQQKRGATKEAIDQAKDEIYSIAGQSARERLKVGFLVKRIAEKEGIRATEQEINLRLLALAQSYQVPFEKFVKDVQEKDGLPEIYQQLLHEKVMDFLHENARIEDVAAAPAAVSEPAVPVS